VYSAPSLSSRKVVPKNRIARPVPRIAGSPPVARSMRTSSRSIWATIYHRGSQPARRCWRSAGIFCSRPSRPRTRRSCGLVSDKVSWSDIAAGHNRLVVSSSPTIFHHAVAHFPNHFDPVLPGARRYGGAWPSGAGYSRGSHVHFLNMSNAIVGEGPPHCRPVIAASVATNLIMAWMLLL